LFPTPLCFCPDADDIVGFDLERQGDWFHLSTSNSHS
jgi:hypothetical protein